MISDMHLLLVMAILFILVLAMIYRIYRIHLRRLEFLFNAIENLDYSFRFPNRGFGSRLDRSLNRIKEVLQQAHYETQEREHYHEQVLSMVSTAILVVDAEGRVLRCNDSARRLFGLEHITHIRQVEGQLQSSRFSLRRNVARINGNSVELWAVSDISSELSLQEMASWEKLIRVLTHEIMNGLSPVTSLSQTLRQGMNVENELSVDVLREGLDTIHATSENLIRFVQNYRRLTLLPVPQPKPFYLKPFLNQMMAQTMALDGAQVIRPEVKVQPPQLMLYADESLLTHVFTNLLKNAVEAILSSNPQESCIRVTAFEDADESVVIQVSNNGPAIPEDVAANVFVPFFTTKVGGSGIGLSLSARIMQASGGVMQLLESKDGFTTFQLKF